MTIDYSEYLKLCQELWEHNKSYYIDHSPKISDYEFDILLKKLEDIEMEHPEWVSSASPTQRVGEMPSNGFDSISHDIPMLSLANTYSEKELGDFIGRVYKNLGRDDVDFSVELKIDGLSLSLLYEDRKLVRGATRGNGIKGDDVTANVRTISSLPLQLVGDDIPARLEVRGEVFMPHSSFKTLNAMRREAGEEPWANPRNAAAGSLKLLDPREVDKRKLGIVLYAVAENSNQNIANQFIALESLKRWGLPTMDLYVSCRTISEIMNFAEKVKNQRSNLPYDIDGIVIKVANFSDRERLGHTRKSPRWAVAYKFAPEQAKTIIKDIKVQVGRSGKLTPVARLEPVFVAGSTISSATLHNQDEIDRKDIRVGDTVIIEKGGDVIPKVVSVDLNARPEDSIPWSMPEFCPECGGVVENVPGEVAVRCSNIKCSARHLQHIIYFVSKDAMDIDHLGEKVVAAMLEKGIIEKTSDIYSLTAEDLSKLDGFKEKSVDNLLRSIEKSRHVPLWRFIQALGIKYVGSGTSQLLAEKAGDISKLIEMTYDELIDLDGIGEKVANSIIDHFEDDKNLQEVELLLSNGVQPYQDIKQIDINHPFYDKTFVITGTLETYSRDQAKALIIDRGGKVSGAVSKNTDYVLAGDNAGSKLEKARKFNINIIDEKYFKERLG